MAEIKDFARMCRHFYRGACSNECPIHRFVKEYGTVRNCLGVINVYPDEADRIITYWCEEHPQKTYAQDFFEKFPSAEEEDVGIPSQCRRAIYGLEHFNCCDKYDNCSDCWNEVIPDA